MTTPVEAALETKLQTSRRFKLPARTTSGLLPRRFEREYRTGLLFFVDTARQILEQLLIPRLPELEAAAGQVIDATRADAPLDDIVSQILIVARGGFEQLTGRERVQTPEEMVTKVTPSQKQATIRQFKGLLGVDLFLDDSRISNILQPFVTENVGLIKSIGDRFFDDIESTVLRNFRSGQRAEFVEELITQRTGVAQSRAKVIARDQMNKLWGDLNRTRQTQAGVNEYKWRTAKDERVRQLHKDREGVTFQWNNPPSDGHPGQPVLCRCWAEPKLNNVLADLEKKADRMLAAQGISF